jgi:hypothetical protein
VALTPEAEALFDAYDEHTTATINASKAEAYRQLYNRAHLKALKLAALQAVGENPVAPMISQEAAMWATTLVTRQTESLIRRFSNGEVGARKGTKLNR